MKKVWILLCLILTLSLSIATFAVNPKIVDDADLLTTAEEARLEKMAQELVDEHGMDVVIVTVDSLGYKSATAYADDYFDYNGYGIGSQRSGILLLISMEDRDWAISTRGEAIDAFTDYGMDELFDSISGDLADNDFYSAFYTYLSLLDDYFVAYENGEPIDVKITFFDILPLILGGLVVGLIAATITVSSMKKGMNTARPQRSAQSYLTPGSYNLKVCQDIFLYSNTTRTRRSESSSSSSGGSRTHRSSSGARHGGRSGKF